LADKILETLGQGHFHALQHIINGPGWQCAHEWACAGTVLVRHIVPGGEVAEWFNAHAWKMTGNVFLNPQTSSCVDYQYLKKFRILPNLHKSARKRATSIKWQYQISRRRAFPCRPHRLSFDFDPLDNHS
jgi:hypothetical protein